MKTFKNPYKNYLYFLYRITAPIIDVYRLYTGVVGYIWYIRDFFQYNERTGHKLVVDTNLFPILDEKTKFTAFDAHYYYQQLWVFENVLKIKPSKHVDIASTYQLSGYISKIVPTVFIDYRPIDTKLDNLSILQGDILRLPFESNSLESISCLHVIEHIGLGRYGDPIDPDGLLKACKELQRVLAIGGKLYISTPIGRERVCFNAHRVTDPSALSGYLNELTLETFNVVTDSGEFIQDAEMTDFAQSDYACGMFTFTKKA